MKEDLDSFIVRIPNTPLHQSLSHASSLVTLVYTDDVKVYLTCQLCHR